MKYFGQYSEGICAAGLQGVVPKLPIDIATLEKKGVASCQESSTSCGLQG